MPCPIYLRYGSSKGYGLNRHKYAQWPLISVNRWISVQFKEVLNKEIAEAV
jgi:hypothetical protein